MFPPLHEPYLGAWAHIMIVSEDRQEFVSVAHPLDAVGEHTAFSSWTWSFYD